MTTYVHCNGYTVCHTGKYDDNAPAECARLESELADGYAVIAYQGGVQVADAEGWHGDDGYYTDAATASGMYDP